MFLVVLLKDSHPFGGMAQLVARFHGMEEARGSNPLTSTKLNPGLLAGI